jgi:hypothetical protein
MQDGALSAAGGLPHQFNFFSKIPGAFVSSWPNFPGVPAQIRTPEIFSFHTNGFTSLLYL